MKDIAVAALRDRLRKLDEEFRGYREDRRSLVDAIQKLGGRPDASDSDRTNGADRGLFETDSGTLSIAEAVRKAASDLPGNFTVGDVRGYIEHHYPGLKVGRRTVGARLWEYCNDGSLELVETGRGGKPNIYKKKTA